MNKYPDFWSVILGNQPPGFFFGYISVSFVSAFGIILVMASQKYKGIDNTPNKWSWKYFFVNNSMNFVASLFVLPIFIRVVIEFIDNPQWLLLISVGLGFGFYKLAKLANNVGIWTTDKISEKIAEKIKLTELNKKQDG